MISTGTVHPGTDKRKKQHSIQAIILGIIAVILTFIPFIGWVVDVLIWLYGLYVGYMASQGTDMDIPMVTEFAKKYA